VFSDDAPLSLQVEWAQIYDLYWRNVPRGQMLNRRATCKIECMVEFCFGLEPEGEVLIADADLYFLSDPFKPFEVDFDLGLTSRGYKYWAHINGGVIYLRPTLKTREFLCEHVNQVLSPTWEVYVEYRKHYGHVQYGLDWTVGQDYLNCVWNHQKDFDLNIVDLTCRYNYCPAYDVFGENAFKMILSAYQQKLVTTLHLKSELKKLIYDNVFEDAVTRHKRGKMRWK